MDTKQLRPSQYVTTYGSGTVVALSDSHVVIPTVARIVWDLQKMQSFNEKNASGLSGLDKFEIRDQKMTATISRLLGSDREVRIFRLPTNADLREPEAKALFLADPFPRWSVCYKHSGTPILSRLEQIGRGVGMRCPACARNGMDPGRGAPVRFIQACQDGHMDDIDWAAEVHHGKECPGTVFLWQETDSNVNFTVRCHGHYDSSGFHITSCGGTTTYFALKRRSENNFLPCSGVFQEGGGKEACTKNPKLTMKNASNLRIPEIVSSVYIPKYPGHLYASLYPFAQLLDRFYQEEFTKDEFIKYLEGKSSRFSIPLDTVRDVEEATHEEIVEAVTNIIEEQDATGTEGDGEIGHLEAINEEFTSLLRASAEGFPPQKMGDPTGFHIEPTDNIDFYSEETGLWFKVTPIRQLLVTRVQLGYYREVVNRGNEEELQVQVRRTGKLIRSYYDEGSAGSQTRWLIGNQLQGEGLFIQSCQPGDKTKHHDPLLGKTSEALDSWSRLLEEMPRSYAEARRKTNPRFVWWHSMSHKIINQLAIDSGFSSSSIGERIYCKWNESRKALESGILLYTAQAGGDGTLGGLTSLAGQFGGIFKNISAEIKTCSNDPVCCERRRTKYRLNGAACHACMLISETSCELQNKFLDRNLIVETMRHGNG